MSIVLLSQLNAVILAAPCLYSIRHELREKVLAIVVGPFPGATAGSQLKSNQDIDLRSLRVPRNWDGAIETAPGRTLSG